MRDFAKDWIAGAGGGCVESVATMPFEVLKTKLQVSQTRDLTWKRFFLQAPSVRSMFAGLTPILLQTSVKIGLRYSTYELLKPVVPSPFLAGYCAGAIEALVWITPTERLKVLFITNGSSHHAILPSVRLLFAQQGVAQGLWRGGTATVLRNACTVGTRFVLFEQLVLRFCGAAEKPTGMQSAGFGFLSGAVTTIAFQPIDVVKTRMGADEHGKYRSNLDCARQLYHERGAGAFLSGLSARLVKISLGQAIVFSTYGKIKSWIN